MNTFLSIYASMVFLIAPVDLNVNGSTCDNGLQGYYVDGIVYLCPSAVDDPWTKFHETGHHIWFKYMTEDQRIYWSTLKGRVSAYAGTNASEDFAETFASYMIERKTGLAEKYRFIRKLKLERYE